MKITEKRLRSIIRQVISESILHDDDLTYAQRDEEYRSLYHDDAPTADQYFRDLNRPEYHEPVHSAKERSVRRQVRDINSLRLSNPKLHKRRVGSFGRDRYRKYCRMMGLDC